MQYRKKLFLSNKSEANASEIEIVISSHNNIVCFRKNNYFGDKDIFCDALDQSSHLQVHPAPGVATIGVVPTCVATGCVATARLACTCSYPSHSCQGEQRDRETHPKQRGFIMTRTIHNHNVQRSRGHGRTPKKNSLSKNEILQRIFQHSLNVYILIFYNQSCGDSCHFISKKRIQVQSTACELHANCMRIVTTMTISSQFRHFVHTFWFTLSQ